MKQQQINVFEPQLRQDAVGFGDGALARERRVNGAHLARDPKVLPRDTAPSDRDGDVAMVVIHLSGVDEPTAGGDVLERRLDQRLALGGLPAARSEAHARHRLAVA
eukprot:4779092-Prymnesium_polylepis.2